MTKDELRSTIESYFRENGSDEDLWGLLADASIHAAILADMPLERIAINYHGACQLHAAMLLFGLGPADINGMSPPRHQATKAPDPSPEQQRHDDIARKLLGDLDGL